MRIVVSGSTGLVGTALTPVLAANGHDVVPLVRRRPVGERAIGWDPMRGTIDRTGLEGADAVIHLASENTFGHWTAAKKRRIRDSRVLGTRLLSEAIAGLARRPQVLLSASATGYYGDRGDEELTEQSAQGDDFLAHVAHDWEAATSAAGDAGIRVVNMRFGVVLDPRGGGLGMMLPFFRLGLGGYVGSGDQYMSWIASHDLMHAIVHLLGSPTLTGPVNVTAPNPVTHRELGKTLGKVLGRPAFVPVPAFALMIVFGRDGAAMVQSGQRALPARLLASGYRFSTDTVEAALRRLLAAPESGR